MRDTARRIGITAFAAIAASTSAIVIRRRDLAEAAAKGAIASRTARTRSAVTAFAAGTALTIAAARCDGDRAVDAAIGGDRDRTAPSARAGAAIGRASGSRPGTAGTASTASAGSVIVRDDI